MQQEFYVFLLNRWFIRLEYWKMPMPHLSYHTHILVFICWFTCRTRSIMYLPIHSSFAVNAALIFQSKSLESLICSWARAPCCIALRHASNMVLAIYSSSWRKCNENNWCAQWNSYILYGIWLQYFMRSQHLYWRTIRCTYYVLCRRSLASGFWKVLLTMCLQTISFLHCF